MPKAISGVIYKKKDPCHLHIVVEFSEEIKELVRENIVSICHGPSRAKLESDIYSPESTLVEFFEIYDDKEMDTKMGMMGELLSHILISNTFKNIKPLSLYFNQEEKSIKKGFDILYGSKGEVWITEVKSGECKDSTIVSKHKELIGSAKRDLDKRLKQNIIARWRGALAGFDILYRRAGEKKIFKEIIQGKYKQAVAGKSKSKDCNAILVSVAFNSLEDVDLNDICKTAVRIQEDKKFKDIIIFLIQKKTLSKLEKFLRGGMK